MTQLIFKQNVTVIFNAWVINMMDEALFVWRIRDIGLLRITSGIEGTHSPTSSHYEGRAIDVSLPYPLGNQSGNKEVAEHLQKRLGSDYFVLCDMNPQQPHIHMQVKRGISP